MRAITLIFTLSTLIGIGVMIAEDKPTPAKLPPVPSDAALHFAALVIQQQQITAQPVYQEIQQRLAAINAEWQKSESETLAAMKLDPKTHTIQVTQDGKVSAILKPTPTPPPATEPAKKDDPAKK